MTNRIKITQPLTRNRAEELLGEIAVLTLERNERKIEMDRRLTAVREEFEAPLSSLGKQIEEKTTLLEAWAAANPDDFPKNRKSIEMTHGTIGYRLGTPKLKTLMRKTWDQILELIRANDWTQFIRTKEEVNKDAILAEYGQDRLSDQQLKHIGVQVVQDESFFVEPKLEDLKNKTTVAA